MPASEVLEIIVKGRDQAGGVIKNLNKNLGETEKRASSLNRTMVSLRGGIGRLSNGLFSLKGVIATIGVGMLARSFMQAATTAESYRTRLVTLMGSMGKANELFDEMGAFASSVSFEYEEIMGAATNLSGIMTGGTEEIKKWMPIISDLAATAGMGIQETTSQVIRMYSAGAASADMFRERGILAMLGFQSGVSVSAEETRKRLIAAYEDPASKIRGAAEALSRTWGGMMSMMGDAWFQFRNMVMDEGVFDFIKAGVALLLEQIKKLKEEGKMEGVAQKMGSAILMVLEKVAQSSAIVADVWRGWKMIWYGLKSTFATFADYVNRGLAMIYDSLDYLVTGIGSAIKGIAGMIETIDITGVSKGITDSVKKAGELLEGMKGVGDEARKRSKYWREVEKESSKVLWNTIGQGSALIKVNKILGSIKKRAAEYAAAAEAGSKSIRPPKVDMKPQAKLGAIIKSQLMRLNELTRNTLSQLEIHYKQGIVKLSEYYDKRQSLMEKQYISEMKVLKEAEEKASDPTKRLQAQDQIFKREQRYVRERIKLLSEREEAEKKLAKDQVTIAEELAKIRGRVEFDSATNLTEAFRQKQVELAKSQTGEIERLKALKAEEAQIEEAHRLHELERDKQLADQRKQIQQLVIDNMKQSLGFMESAFADAYTASGNTIKEFFYAQKAASIANTIISTYEAAQKAYSSLAGIPIVGPGLGVAAAGAAILAGMAKVAVIRAQSLATGGVVEGYSPSKTADNVHIQATAGEFMHPVDTVKYYGAKTMEAIRRRLVPREFLQGFSPQSFQPNYSYAMASGGSVPASSPDQKTETTIINMTDARELDQYLATPGGQNAVLNIISSRAPAVKRILR